MSAGRHFHARAGCIAVNTLREAVRQKFAGLLGLLAVGIVAGTQLFRDFHFGSPELKFIADAGEGAIAVFGTVLAIVATAQLFFGEIESGTVQTLLAKPVHRWEFILGKYLGVAVLTGAFCALLTAVLMATLWTRESAMMREIPEAFAGGRAVSYIHVASAGLLIWLKLLMLAALTLLVASYAQTQLFTTVTGFLIFGACHLAHFARVGPVSAGWSTGFITRALPDFHLFTLSEAAGGAAQTGHGLAVLALYTFVYVATAGGLAVFCFNRREL